MVPPAKVVERETADSLAKAVADELAFVTDSSASQLDFLLCDLRLLNSDSEWRRLFGAEPVGLCPLSFLKFLHADFVMWPQDAGAEGAAAGGKGRRQAPKHGVAALRRYRYGGVLFPFIIRRMFVCVCVQKAKVSLVSGEASLACATCQSWRGSHHEDGAHFWRYVRLVCWSSR